VKDNTHLATILTNKNYLRPGLEKRITYSNITYYALLPLPEPISTQSRKKIQIYKTF
jgi:hypothetical protein